MPVNTLEKIRSFRLLSEGWSYGEGVVFQPQILQRAGQLIKTAQALGFWETDAFPGLNGEIMITLYAGQNYWEFTLEPDESVTFVYELGDETGIYEEGLPFEFAVSMITNLAIQNNTFIFGKPAITKIAA